MHVLGTRIGDQLEALLRIVLETGGSASQILQENFHFAHKQVGSGTGTTLSILRLDLERALQCIIGCSYQKIWENFVFISYNSQSKARLFMAITMFISRGIAATSSYCSHYSFV